jgi:hypothetical protein
VVAGFHLSIQIKKVAQFSIAKSVNIDKTDVKFNSKKNEKGK